MRAFQHIAITSQNGDFEFPAALEGRSLFSAWRNPPYTSEMLEANPFLNDLAGNGGFSSQPNAHADGQATIAVDHDIDDFNIHVDDRPSPVLVRFMAGLADSKEAEENWRGSVMLAPEGSSFIRGAALKSDGTLLLTDVEPGRYYILPVPRLPDGSWLSSVLLGNQDVTGQAVSLAQGSPAIRLFYKKNGGAIRGKIEGGGDATVVLVPQTAFGAPVSDYAWFFHCDPEGSFALAGLRPGNYYAWAFDVGPKNLPGVDALRALVPGSTAVRIEEGVTANPELKVTHVRR